ncbi:MAG: hypothetical protein A2919_00640 [Candidatus Spechtbacteria bacterium RIFCSPLOWO2_01_FULL_43_12]|uniref:Uncharacterized protein n=1 Tax=Candidatus Spechtbacteria bacterium RIFCSPLOWO2_01_FULL_43_12 TaxID=1802162 RepID=A0A1G2HEU5_9BACT|nr:MAG: hypothetical protein A2919_00640 [Candidatus Spechtbacteria bacterium RIFCSPLOWO2_01_FULL_43_12]
MPRYEMQRYFPSGGSSWTVGESFEANNIEHAKQVAMRILSREPSVRLGLGRLPEKIRIVEIVFEGSPYDAGYEELVGDEGSEKIRSDSMFRHIEMYISSQTRPLDYDNLRFVLQTLSEPLDGAGYEVRLVYGSGYGSMVSGVSGEEARRIIEVAELRPGDTTISAYWVDGPEPPVCVSVAKVKSWEDCDMPREVVHIWPIDKPNLAIDPRNLSDKKIEDRRQIER